MPRGPEILWEISYLCTHKLLYKSFIGASILKSLQLPNTLLGNFGKFQFFFKLFTLRSTIRVKQ